jgi:hypothetical protein
MRDQITFTHTDDDGNETEHCLPARWEICGACDGCGTDRGRSVECDGGGFTASEWSEQDDDFKDDYLSGVYDRQCTGCRGTGKVQTPDRERANPATLALWDEQQQFDAEMAAERRAELRYCY